jgi:hypothetical protein
MEYVYKGAAATPLAPFVPLAYEPEVYENHRWVLFSDGAVRRLTANQLAKALEGGKQ